VREQRVVSAGAFQKIQWHRVEDPEAFVKGYAGRVVATVPASNASALTEYAFADTDVLLFGSESAGLPDNVVAACAGAVTILSHGQTQILNLAVALGVVLFECERQLALPRQLEGLSAHADYLPRSQLFDEDQTKTENLPSVITLRRVKAQPSLDKKPPRFPK
jgi:tRNA(Leu) C34 or U34 (ribose-2'-O)-methylase TrmL